MGMEGKRAFPPTNSRCSKKLRIRFQVSGFLGPVLTASTIILGKCISQNIGFRTGGPDISPLSVTARAGFYFLPRESQVREPGSEQIANCYFTVHSSCIK